jgi:peptidoglycan/LPS O-acetylase OafA/YrhL
MVRRMSGAKPTGADSCTIARRIVDTNGYTSGFDVLRITLAIGVLCWHSIYSSYGPGLDASIWQGPFRALPGLILPMFFALSGYLVAGSLFRCRSLLEFFTLRVLRLMPALFVEVCLSALLLGPLVTELPWSRYFAEKQFYLYWANIVGYIHYNLPGVFEANPVSAIVNVSLWTVPFELDCYIALGLLAATSVVRKPGTFFVVFLAASVVLAWVQYALKGWLWTRPADMLLVLCFLAGLTLYVIRDYVPLRPDLFTSSIVMSVLTMSRPDTCYFAPLPIAYATVYIGLLNSPRIPLLMSGDYSYGVYLYAFPIQQTFCWAFPSYRVWWLNILFALPLTLAWAAMSWTFVEKPMLRRKKLVTSLVEQRGEAAKRRIGTSIGKLIGRSSVGFR